MIWTSLPRRRWRWATLALALCLLASCATRSGKPGAGGGPGKGHAPDSGEPGRLSLVLTPGATLGDAVYQVMQGSKGNLVCVNGIENRLVGGLEFGNESFETVAQRLAEAAHCKLQAFPEYLFIYPEGYETLLGVSLEGRLDPAYDAYSAALAFGYGTPLYEAFALISHTLGITLVADNLVAAARTGAIIVPEIPLKTGLAAMLQSARVPQEAFLVESSGECIFIYGKQNASPRESLVNADALTPEQTALLDKRVSLVLPAPPQDPAHVAAVTGAKPLSGVLAALAKQTGVPVSADDELAALPINPCAMHGVRLRTAMNLIVRQWLQPLFGYEVVDGGIRFRLRPPEAPETGQAAPPAPEQAEPAATVGAPAPAP